MARAGLVGPLSVGLTIDQLAVVHLGTPLPARLDKIQWGTHRHVYWMAMTEPTMWNLFVCTERVLARGYRYLLLVGATSQAKRILFDDPEETLLVAEMISIGNSRHVRVWWSMNSPIKAMDLLFRGHCTGREDGTPPPGTVNVGPHQQNVKTTPGPPRGVIVPLVLLIHPDPPWSTFSVKFEKSVDQSRAEWTRWTTGTTTPLGGPGAFRTTLDHAPTCS